MASPKTFLQDNVTKNLDLTLEVEIPLEPSGSCSSSGSISLGPVKVPFGTSTQPQDISGDFTTKELENPPTGNLP